MGMLAYNYSHRTALLGFVLAVGSIHASAQDIPPMLGWTTCCPNNVVRYDPVTDRTTVIAEVGTGRFIMEDIHEYVDSDGVVHYDTTFGFEGDLFVGLPMASVLSPDGVEMYLIRNFRLISAHLRTGEIREIGPLSDVGQLISFDRKRNRILGMSTCCPNRLVQIDPVSGLTSHIADLGIAERILVDVLEDEGPDGEIRVDSLWHWKSSIFWPLSPAIVSRDGELAFFIRNGRILTVYTTTGSLADGPSVEGAMLLTYDEAERILYLISPCCPRQIMGYSPDTNVLEPVMTVATSEFFTASYAAGLHDEANDRVFFRRDGSLISVVVSGEEDVVEHTFRPDFGMMRLLAPESPVSDETQDDRNLATLTITAYPNPFRTTAEIKVTLAQSGTVTLEVYDVAAQRIAVLHEGWLSGQQVHRFAFAGDDLPSGAYLMRVVAGEVTRALVLIRIG